MDSTLMVLNRTNPVHIGMAEAIGATQYVIKRPVKRGQFPLNKMYYLVKDSLGIPGGFDFALCESCYYYPALKRRISGLKSKIININCGPLLYHLMHGRISGMERRLLMSLLKEVDGHVVQGTYGIELVNEIDPGKPTVSFCAYVPDETYQKMVEIDAPLESNEVTIIATHDMYYKGVDILIKAFNIASKSMEMKLNIIGNIPKEDILRLEGANHKDIIIHGRVPDLGIFLEKTALYVHPSRGDTFPMSTMEPMLAGIPAIVSEHTGTKDIVGKADKSMVCKLEPDDLAERILAYLGKDVEERRELGKRMKEYTLPYNRENQMRIFVERYEELKRQLSG